MNFADGSLGKSVEIGLCSPVGLDQNSVDGFKVNDSFSESDGFKEC